ncbi:MAG: DUF1800 family protein [Alphaproteobacteria bacterium]|nr:DUF1800 family protein [Alphaproteobacteria bacterium]
MTRSLVLLLAVGCAGVDPDGGTDDGVDTDTTPSTADGPRQLLSPTEQAVRISTALRARHPTAAELQAVADDPAALDALVDTWLDDPALGATIRSMYAEVLLQRSVDLNYPPLGPLIDATRQELVGAVAEEPLALIERVVTQGLPFTDIVTADWTVLDSTASQMWSGHDYPQGASGEQVVHYTDGRPLAGILSTNGLWARHVSAGSNYHRGRANLIADALLCEDFLARDVPIPGDLDLSDDAVVANALAERPECVSCHQALDPLAANLWDFHPEYTTGAVATSYLAGCATGAPFLGLCYPFDPYRPALGLGRVLLRLREPGYYGTPTDDLADVGADIAADPRFARCTVQRFWSWFTETPLEDAPFEVVARLQQDFVASGYDARALLRTIVTHPDFLAVDANRPELAVRAPGPLVVRPFQHARIVEGITGFSWKVKVDDLLCTAGRLGCYGDVVLAEDDVKGFRAMTGGVDGARVTSPTHTMTPVKALFAAALAEEAAGWVVRQELGIGAGTRRLFTQVDADTTDEVTVRAQLASLHADVLAELVAPDDPAVDASFALWSTVLARGGSPLEAWKATLSAMLQSPQILLY